MFHAYFAIEATGGSFDRWGIDVLLAGAQKAIGELMVYDMTRKGFIDGRSLRLPT